MACVSMMSLLIMAQIEYYQSYTAIKTGAIKAGAIKAGAATQLGA